MPRDSKRHTLQAKRSNLKQNANLHGVQKRDRTTSNSKRHLVRDSKRYKKTSHTSPVALQHALRLPKVNGNTQRFSRNTRVMAARRRLLNYESKDLVENFDVLVQKYKDELLRNDVQTFTSGPWTSWSSCSTTCGDGQRFRTRACNDLANPCSNIPMDVQQCSMGECPT